MYVGGCELSVCVRGGGEGSVQVKVKKPCACTPNTKASEHDVAPQAHTYIYDTCTLHIHYKHVTKCYIHVTYTVQPQAPRNAVTVHPTGDHGHS